jgi:F0F1-type ATP synthase membrane subunit c/vacuolar-type H+-ATPase subunit K
MLGLSVNLITTIVLVQPKMKNPFNQLLTVLALVDSLFLFCIILESLMALGIDSGI